jgi:formamidopyrimidine-DNA glycosylase
MEINEKELIEIEQMLLKTITGNGLAIHRFIEWIKLNNSYILPRPKNICARCLGQMEYRPKGSYHNYYCPKCKLGED